KWFADFGPGVGREITTHSLVATSAGSASLTSGIIVQHVKFDGTGGPVVRTTPGATITGHFDYQYWSAPSGSGSCPSCVAELIAGVDGVGQLYCVPFLNSSASTYPGTSGTENFTFTAPSTPGQYVMRYQNPLLFQCTPTAYFSGTGVDVA